MKTLVTSLTALLIAIAPAAAQSSFVPSVAGAGANKTATPVLGSGSGGAYSAGYCVGTALPFDLSKPTSGTPIPQNGSFYLTGLTLFDGSKQNVPLNAFVLNAQPSGSYSDHAACTLSSADEGKVIGMMQWGSYTPDGANSLGFADGLWSNGVGAKQIALGLNKTTFWLIPFVPNGGTAPTYTGNNLTINAQVAY